MSEHCHDGNEHESHHSACANLFGCGDERGTGIIREDIKDAVFQQRTADTLLHMDKVSQESLDGYLRHAAAGVANSCRRAASWVCSPRLSRGLHGLHMRRTRAPGR